VPKGEDPYAILGEDATRWLFLRARPHTVPRVDTSLLVQRESNPLFRVRYAHARTRAVLRDARALGIIRDPAVPPFPPSFPQSTSEVPEPGPGREVGGGPPVQQAVDALLGTLGDHPGVLAAACRLRAPDRVARHLEQTADAVLRYSASCRLLPLGDEKPSAAHGARIALAEAAGTVLACGLSLLGIDAPEHL
jgi:arginyl-tRNA synthetase